MTMRRRRPDQVLNEVVGRTVSAMDEQPREPADYGQGLPDHHDPLAGIGGAPPAYSALTLRLLLAGFGLVFCTGAAVAAAIVGAAWVLVAMALGAIIAAIDIIVIIRRKRRGEPG
jgi:hypothetical protein